MTEPTSAFKNALQSKKTPAPIVAEGGAKFTLELDANTDIVFEQLRLNIKRRVGKSVRKADVLRALIMLAADDPTVANQVVEDLKAK